MELRPFHIPTSHFFKKSILWNDEEAESKVKDILGHLLGTKSFFFVPSCFAALELAAYSLDFTLNDEVILPSFTHVSVANAFQRAGAKIILVDCLPETMNIDPESVLKAISKKTKAIVYMHYAGNSTGFTAVQEIAKSMDIALIEDAAQSIGSSQEKKHLGTLGDFGCFSFDYQKNVECGQGGLLVCNNEKYLERLQRLYLNGTNQIEFNQGKVDYFDWQDFNGGNYRFSSHLFQILLPQLFHIDTINGIKLKNALDNLNLIGSFNFNSAHFFKINEESNHQTNWILFEDHNEEKTFIHSLKEKNIPFLKHYYPLHLSKMGKNLPFHETTGTAKKSKNIIRLPTYIR